MKNYTNEPSLSVVIPFFNELETIEEIFNDSISSYQENIILFYKRGEEKLLLLFKSFYPLSFTDKISLPHFCLYLSDKKTINL